MARTPLYKTAETEMITRIKSGAWEVGRRLPNEFQLADEFGVSQGTMRRALISLEGMGLLNRKPGRGTLVAAKKPPSKSAPSGAAPMPVVLDADGDPLKLSTFRARRETRRATPDEVAALGADRVAVLERTLKSGGDRAAMDVVVVAETLIDTLDEGAPIPLAGVLAHHGIDAPQISADASAEITDMTQSVALAVDRHTALLVVRFLAHDADGQAIAQQTLRIAVPGAYLSHRAS